MTWIGKWLQSVAGDWFGTDEVEAPGAMRATLCGFSMVSAQIDGTSGPVSVNISANLHGAGALTATIPNESISGGGVRRLLRTVRSLWKKPEPIPVAMVASISGNGYMVGVVSAESGMVASINGISSVSSRQQATAQASAGLYGSGNASGKCELQKRSTLEIHAILSGYSSLNATGVSIRIEIKPKAADNRDEEELTMLLLLAA